jgi:galactofuranosylgalactofuranosylrhamnosyl-N-acetylglucosaminyl-diphospho-decaprenol beta-1,5/1,6-galactofuranosyltransferase
MKLITSVRRALYRLRTNKTPFPVDAWTDERYPVWLEMHRATEDELARQRLEAFRSALLFSIVVPLYQTPLPYLHDMVESVLAQTYARFELILVNASPERVDLVEALDACACSDRRVRVVTLEDNYGITENTKRGIAESSGDFVCFLDHDDFVEPDLLYEYESALAKDPEIDVLYCDEDLVTERRNGSFNHKNPLFKPAHSPELLLCKNYAVHLLTIRRSILEEMPELDAQLDGSQDHAMLMFAASRARKVHGVQKVLYHWRVSDTSTSANPEAKPYSEVAARRAIGRELDRRGIHARILSSPLPNLYYLWFNSAQAHSISVIVRCSVGQRGLTRFVSLFSQVSAYHNLELVAVMPPGADAQPPDASFPVRIVESEKFSNTFSSLNEGARCATGDYLVFVDDSCSFITPEPLEQLVELCAIDGVGAAAPKTLYFDGTNRCYGIGITAERIMPLYRGYADDFPGYQCGTRVLQDLSAASWRGLIVSRCLFEQVGGFDDTFEAEIGSADFCKRVRDRGMRIVQTPTVKVRTSELCPKDPFGDNSPDFTHADLRRFDEKWPDARAQGDPYINHNLDQSSEYFMLSACHRRPDTTAQTSDDAQDRVQNRREEEKTRTFKLANVLLNVDDFLSDNSELLFRSDSAVACSASNRSLRFSGTIDFLTYFNSVSVRKWKQYADVDDIRLHLELAGDSCEIKMTGVAEEDLESGNASSAGRSPDPLSRQNGIRSRVVGTGELTLAPDSKGYKAFDVSLPGSNLVIGGFSLRSDGTTTITNAYWYTEVDERRIHRVDLALVVTTFRREQYVQENIELVKKQILDGGLLASVLHMFVVDNGRTLDAESLSDDGVTVIPNANVGGAGGFACGMLAALEDDCDYTHVLLMDDDVRMCTESFVRTFNLLSLVNERYSNAFINGAMLQLEHPNLQYEDVSFVKRDGGYDRIKKDLAMDSLADVVLNECINVEVPQAYGAWWFSCIPMAAVRAHGLPLPLFVRCDDVEYGMRCRPVYMTMNGICVWHAAFGQRFRAAVDCYQYMRNFLITIACDGGSDPLLFIARQTRMFEIFLKMMAYEAAELLLKGFEDYLKGPDYLVSASGEELLKENNAQSEKLVPLDEAIEDAVERHPELKGQFDGFKLDHWNLLPGEQAPLSRKVLRTFALDRHKLPDALLSDRPQTVYYASTNSADSMHATTRVLVASDREGKNAHVRVMDRARRARLEKRWRAACKRFAAHNDEIAQSYHAYLHKLTSPEFWQHYLQGMR